MNPAYLISDESTTSAVRRAKVAQGVWGDRRPRERLRLLGRVAGEIAEHQSELLALNPRPNASSAEFLSSELFPLADACRFVSCVGQRALSPTTHSMRHGAWWMGRISVRVTRQPWGTVLIIAPSNYPLFLPGVQMVQALAAGNAVLVKPAAGCTAIMQRFRQCLTAVGVPGDLVQILDSSIEAGQAAIAAGVDKVVLTGSVDTGRAVLSQLGQSLTPSTMELSGCDAVFITEQADLGRAAKCLAYALQLNGGATCIAPRRVFVFPSQVSKLCTLLVQELHQAEQATYQVPREVQEKIATAASAAVTEGAQTVIGQMPEPSAEESSAVTRMGPLVLRDVQPHMAIAQGDFFGPVLSILTVPDMTAAIIANLQCPYSLGAALFGPTRVAEHWGPRIRAGCIVINDIIVPTADPRVPFGGCDQSGWGVTRGWDGLLDLSRPQVICTRLGNWLPHLDRRHANNIQLLAWMLKLFHGRGLRNRLVAMRNVIGCLLRP